MAWTESSIWRTQITESVNLNYDPCLSRKMLTGELIHVAQSMLYRQLTVMLQSDGSLRRETAEHYLPHADPVNPFDWSDD